MGQGTGNAGLKRTLGVVYRCPHFLRRKHCHPPAGPQCSRSQCLRDLPGLCISFTLYSVERKDTQNGNTLVFAVWTILASVLETLSVLNSSHIKASRSTMAGWR